MLQNSLIQRVRYPRHSIRHVANQAIQGNWKGAVPIPSTTLEQREEILQGEPQQLFLAFMRKMLQWRPEERSSAKELLADQWLLSP